MRETLESIMDELQARINTEDTATKVTQEEIEEQKAKTVVVMPAGGKGARIRTETQSEEIHKVMVKIDGKRSMIEKTVQDYTECGFEKFVVLTGYFAEKVEDHLGNGSRWDVEIIYSQDPDGKKVGNAGAFLHALNNGSINENLSTIVHNPDDVIIGLDRPYGEMFLEGHLKGKKNGCINTFVVVPQTPFQFTGLIIKRGKVQDIAKYPPIAIPAHTGITLFEPEVYDYFRKLVSLDIESSFENVISPTLAKEGRIFAINIPSGTWIPINDLKGLQKARTALHTDSQIVHTRRGE